MIVAAAFCPTPPLLHPRGSGAAGQDLAAALQVACAQALGRVLACGPDAVLVLGPGEDGAVFGPGDAGDLRGYGIPVEVGFDGPRNPAGTHVSVGHMLGAWLLDQSGFAGRRVGVTAGCPGPDFGGETWAVLVMADGSARRTESSPGWYDPEAIPFDDLVTAALADGDATALANLDETMGARVLAAGTSAWRRAGVLLSGTAWAPALHYADAPFGVHYLVASWLSAP